MPHTVQNSTYKLKQDINWVQAAASAAGFNCCRQLNAYTLYEEDGKTVAYSVREQSNMFCRCCCAPVHAFQLNVFAGAKDPKDEKVDDAVMTMYHPFKIPPCCPICCNMCRGEMIVYDGYVDVLSKSTEEIKNIQNPILSTAKQPTCGGVFQPAINIFDGAAPEEGNDKATYTVKGPFCCIGGLCGNICFPPTFHVFEGKGEGDAKELTTIEKDFPEGAGGFVQQVCTTADNFTINMPEESTPASKAAMLGSSLLIDYLFFEEGANIYCDVVEQELVCVCCNFYCCGALCPCTLRLSFANKDD